MYCPSGPNSRICAAVLPWAGRALDPPRENTKTWPLEFTATPAASPRCRSGGSFRKFGTESYGIEGAGCPALPSSCASAGAANAMSAAASQCFIKDLPWSYCSRETELSRLAPYVRGGARPSGPRLFGPGKGPAELRDDIRARGLHAEAIIRRQWLGQDVLERGQRRPQGREFGFMLKGFVQRLALLLVRRP